MVKSDLKKRVENYVDKMKDDLIGLSREIHANPETLFKEYKCARILSSFLEERGFDVETGAGGLETAFKATARGSKGRPAVCFMAEYDAVPEIGHGCGHNLSGMASVGAAIAVSKLLDKLKGSIIVMGTPAEEGGGGKVIMLENGAFEGVDVAMMVHACNFTKIAYDSVAIPVYRFHFRGQSAHASVAPHEGLNALDAAVLTYSAIGLLRQQMKGDCRIHIQIIQAETAINMIPESASCIVVLRARSERELEDIAESVKKCAQGGALATACKLDMEKLVPSKNQRIQGSSLGLKHNHVLEEMFLQNLSILGITEEYPTEMWITGTDAGNLSHVIPTIHPMVAICGPEVSPHTKEFVAASKSTRGEETFISCAKAMAMTAVEILELPEKMAEIEKCAHKENVS